MSAIVAAVLIAMTSLTGCKEDKPAMQAETSKAEVDSLKAVIASLVAGTEETSKNLVKFDTLDFKVYSGQQWSRVHETHSEDVICHWPDGKTTKGLAKHIEDLKALFVFAPDTKVIEHPISFGSGNKTAVTGTFECTFTKPMPIGGGKFIQPTGKKAKMAMCTIGIWKDGVMTEEYLYWDNLNFMQQLGIKQ